jgi:hypothetical protein
MKHAMSVWMLCAAAALAPQARAQQAAPAAQEALPAWEQLPQSRRDKLVAPMRALFERTRDMPRQQRRETLALYRAMLPMSPSEREALKQRWAGMTTEQRREWLRANAPRWRDGPGRGPDTPR